MTKSNTLKINIHEAKTHLSKYLHQVEEEGKNIILCRNGDPVAEIKPLKKKKGKKRVIFGLGKGMVTIPDSFYDELTDEDFPGIGL